MERPRSKPEPEARHSATMAGRAKSIGVLLLANVALASVNVSCIKSPTLTTRARILAYNPMTGEGETELRKAVNADSPQFLRLLEDRDPKVVEGTLLFASGQSVGKYRGKVCELAKQGHVEISGAAMIALEEEGSAEGLACLSEIVRGQSGLFATMAFHSIAQRWPDQAVHLSLEVTEADRPIKDIRSFVGTLISDTKHEAGVEKALQSILDKLVLRLKSEKDPAQREITAKVVDLVRKELSRRGQVVPPRG